MDEEVKSVEMKFRERRRTGDIGASMVEPDSEILTSTGIIDHLLLFVALAVIGTI